MNFIASENGQAGAAALAERLTKELSAGKQVLWLVSGGSNIAATVMIMHSLDDRLTTNLRILLVDERYGPPEHANSNWMQLLQAGFETKQATAADILAPETDFAATAARYENTVSAALQASDIVIAQLGIGPDGHTAGILPHSLATEPTDKLVVAYDSLPYQRLTCSFAVLRQIDVSYSFVFGEAKKPALDSLQAEALSLDEQPAQILKELPEAYIYSDQVVDAA